MSRPDLKIKCVYFHRNFESMKKRDKVIIFLGVSSNQLRQNMLIKLNLNKIGEIILISKNCRGNIKMIFCSYVNKKQQQKMLMH